jgi:hypothetical protein
MTRKSQFDKLSPDPTNWDTPSLAREGKKFASELWGELKTRLFTNN